MDFGLIGRIIPIMMQYAAVTLALTAATFVFGMMTGAVIALGRIHKWPVLGRLFSLHVSLVRGTPLMIQLFLIYFGLPQFGVVLSPLASALLGMVAFFSAYAAEIMRGGLLAVPKGQFEAAYSLGMTYIQAMRRIIMPQALRSMLPPLGNQVISLVKDTSLVATITVVELTRTGQQIAASTFKPFEVYLVVALLYWGITSLLSMVQGKIEVRLSRAF